MVELGLGWGGEWRILIDFVHLFLIIIMEIKK
jgi:hypothetical protein